jgi:hypothetical protein
MEKLESFTLNNSKVKYVSTKELYGSQFSFFVIEHGKTKEQFDELSNQEKYANAKMPFWLTDTGDYLLKVKDKFIAPYSFDLKHKYKCDLHFEAYQMNDANGFYIKMDKITPTNYQTNTENRKVININ